MPRMNSAGRAPDAGDTSTIYVVQKDNTAQLAYVLQRRAEEAYVHYLNEDKRLDEWVREEEVRVAEEGEVDEVGNGNGMEVVTPPVVNGKGRGKKRKRTTFDLGERGEVSGGGVGVPQGGEPSASGSPSTSAMNGGPPVQVEPPAPSLENMTEEEYDIQHHKQITAKRNFDHVIFGTWKIKTWYFSPYPLSESESDDTAGSAAGPSQRIPGVARATMRSHGRTSDILAGGLQRARPPGEKSVLWVCDRCFKYMSDGQAWELHTRRCSIRHPPGRKVYQRGAHIIWEVDGAREKLFCQCLALFGKLFIDIKTLFYDLDNFLFYIVTDADSQRDHVLGFFSKEKISYDDYNLACIVVLPPYQRKGYGMLMIEFSYELSRRAGKIGTPERPLSDLGLRSYLTYWISVLIRFFRRLLSVLPPDLPRLVTAGMMPDLSRLRSASTESGDSTKSKTKRKSVKGWDGEVGSIDPSVTTAPPPPGQDPLFTTTRTVETTPNSDGSATTHVIVKCTLADIAKATNMRVEDAAFALNECGLLLRRKSDGTVRTNEENGEEVLEREIVVVSREMVELVASERKIKKMMMDMNHVLL